jgi:hypothetical protein
MIYEYEQSGRALLACDYNARVGLNPGYIVCDIFVPDIDPECYC